VPQKTDPGESKQPNALSSKIKSNLRLNESDCENCPEDRERKVTKGKEEMKGAHFNRRDLEKLGVGKRTTGVWRI